MQLLDDLSIPQKGREHMLALDDVQKRELLQNHQGARADGKRKGRHAATSAPGLGSPLPHLHRDWASWLLIFAAQRLRDVCTLRQDHVERD